MKRSADIPFLKYRIPTPALFCYVLQMQDLQRFAVYVLQLKDLRLHTTKTSADSQQLTEQNLTSREKPRNSKIRIIAVALTKVQAACTILVPHSPAECARVAELADALDSGSSGRKTVEVRVLSRAPKCF
jgi:hypothetical protein